MVQLVQRMRKVPRVGVLYTRVSVEEHHAFQVASRLAGVKVSQWARERLRVAAIQELRSCGEEVAFLEEVKG